MTCGHGMEAHRRSECINQLPAPPKKKPPMQAWGDFA